MPTSRGFTLIEMVAIITISAALAGIAVVLLQVLLTGQRAAKAAQEHAAIFRRLADDFRRDVHAAREAEPGESALTLRGFSPGSGGRRVRYEIHANEVLRCEEGENGPDRRESYFLPKTCSAAFRQKTELSAQVIALTPVPPAESPPEAFPTTSVEAVLGRDHRFEKVEKKE
jgi:hypothetical protein